MNRERLITELDAGKTEFSDVIDFIDTHFNFTPTAFRNGDTHNAADTNNGSCKIFAFAMHEELSEQATLHAFGEYYRTDVLKNPEGNDHANIRNFMRSGWAGITFDNKALVEK